jgi:hypothetical protein
MLVSQERCEMSYVFSQNCSSQVEASTLYWKRCCKVWYKHSREALHDVSQNALPDYARCNVWHRRAAFSDGKDTHLCDVWQETDTGFLCKSARDMIGFVLKRFWHTATWELIAFTSSFVQLFWYRHTRSIQTLLRKGRIISKDACRQYSVFDSWVRYRLVHTYISVVGYMLDDICQLLYQIPQFISSPTEQV